MGTSSIARRKALIEKYKGRPLMVEAVDPEFVDDMLACDIDHERLKKLNVGYYEPIPLDVPVRDAQELINDLKAQFQSKRYQSLLDETRREAINSIVGPLGIGKFLSIFDKDGGNVTTIHNAEQGIYARDEDKYNRRDYTDTANSGGKRFSGGGRNSVGAEVTRSQLDSNDYLKDGYTGSKIKGSDSSPDHVISLSEAHKNGGFMLSSKRKADIATDTDNLVSTRRDINQSMKDNDKMEWVDSKQGGREVSNEEYFDIDRNLLEANYKKGREAIDKHLPSDVEKSIYYSVNSAKTGCAEGTKMGVQQAFGILLSEMINALFDEIKDMFSNGISPEGFWDDLKKRFKRISLSVSGRWKEVIKGFRDGFFSGFVSNLITTIANTITTTGKKFVRMIREGIFSLLKAMKMIFFPPEGMSRQQAKHEGLKLILSGAVVVGSVAFSEVIETFILTVPVLTPIASIISTMITGLTAGVSIAIGCYLLDKMDFWGVIRIEEHNFIMDELQMRKDALIAEENALNKESDDILPQLLPSI